jgi:hypothetical protein
MNARRLLLALAIAGCVGSQDDPSQVHDLRVLGVQMDPPEIMIVPPAKSSCFGLFGGLAAAFSGGDAGLSTLAPILPYLQPVNITWLIEDPDGGDRDISYDISACASVDDLTCTGDAGYIGLTSGTTKAGELKFSDALATEQASDGGGYLLLNVFNNDLYKGLGGIRVPVVIHLKAGDEEIYAQKLMVYSCQILPGMKANLQPVLPGVRINDVDWPDGVTQPISGHDAPLLVSPKDYLSLQEDYVVPSFELKPVNLTESWKISYYTTLGRFDSSTLGGTDFTGSTDIQINTWHPGHDGGVPEQDVDFWFVVRDGRGGESWLQRKAHYTP